MCDGDTITTQLDLAGTIRSKEIGALLEIEVWRMDENEEWDVYSGDVTLGETESVR